MKFSIVPIGVVPTTLNGIQVGLIAEFREPNSKSQCITEIKEIKQLPTESVWDFDQRFKTLMAKVSFQMSYVQQKECFIVALLPHIQTPLMQHNIVSWIEDLEIAMKLEASPVGDIGLGIMQI